MQLSEDKWSLVFSTLLNWTYSESV
jgi:hypothetical protein